MRKVMSVILSILLIAMMLFIPSNTIFAECKASFDVSSHKILAGDTVNVTIDIKNSPGVSAAKLSVYYDSELTLNGVTYNSELIGMCQKPAGLSSPVILNWVSLEEVSGDITFATLHFATDDDISLGEKIVDIKFDPVDVCDIDENSVAFSVTRGGVTVVDCLHANKTDYPAVASTCTVAGHAAYTLCNDCENVISGDNTPLALAQHTPGTAKRENEVVATCTTGGSYDEVVKCTVCGTEISRNYETVEPLNHNWGEWTIKTAPTCVAVGQEIRVCANDAKHTDSRNIGATGIHTGPSEWSYDSGAHWKECTVCHIVIGGDLQAHTFEYKTTKEVTATEDGLKEEVCTVCGYKTGNKEIITNYTDTADTAYDATSTSQGAVALSTKMKKANLTGIVINGVTLTEDDYELTEDDAGNAKVTIKPAYLAKLANGSYTIKIVGTDGEAVSTLAVANSTVGATAATNTTTTTTTATDSTVKSPKDSDNDIAFLVMVLLAAMGSSIFAGVSYRRKKSSK